MCSMEGSGRRLSPLPGRHAGPHEGCGLAATGWMAGARRICAAPGAEQWERRELQQTPYFGKVEKGFYMIRFRAIWLVVLALVLLAGLVALPGCLRKGHEDRVVALGTPVAVGQLTYTAIESEWRETLESSNGQRIPRNRYLMINISVLNNAPEERAAPLLQVEDAKGRVYQIAFGIEQ